MRPESPEGRPYPISLLWDEASDGHSGWVAAIDVLPGCVSQGETAEAAIEGLAEAARGWIEVARKRGMQIPEPRATDEYSGRFLVRAPSSLHERLVLEAAAESVSLNQFVTNALAGAVGWRAQTTLASGSGSSTTPGGTGDVEARRGRQPGKRAATARDPAPDFAAQVAAAPQAQRQAMILTAVRAQVAATLGRPSLAKVDPTRELLELGFDSLNAVELRNRLGHLTGRSLPTTLAFDYPSAAAIAAYLTERLAPTPAAGDPSPNPLDPKGGGALTGLFCHAHEQGALVDALQSLRGVSRFQRAFEAPPREPVPAVTLARDRTGPRLICVPAYVAGSGPHQFARFAKAFDGEVKALWLPGFRRGETAPATWQAAIEALAASTAAASKGDTFVLVGYSFGGAVTHALAEHLEREGRGPAAVVMVDTFMPTGDHLTRVLADLIGSVLDRFGDVNAIADHNLIAMGAYLRLVSEWRPGALAAPVLLLRSHERITGAVDTDQLPPGQAADEMQVGDDHFAIIEWQAELAAAAAAQWLEKRIGSAAAASAGRAVNSQT